MSKFLKHTKTEHATNIVASAGETGDIEFRLATDLRAIEAAGRRQRRVTAPTSADNPTHVRVDGKGCVAFCNNDYLGLAGHSDVRTAFIDAANRYGVGSGASHLISGHGPEHHALEEELADFVQRPRALLFSTGYMANLGIASALLRQGDRVLEDRLNHASLLDAGLTHGVRLQRYAHADVAAAERKLCGLASSALPAAKASRTLLMTDGVFSMDGDVAPLRELAAASTEHSAWLMVDDAHGFGVLGPEGRGSVLASGLTLAEVPIYMATLGKAAGVFGAFVAGSDALIDTLIQKSRTYIYTTALPPAVAAAARAALRAIKAETWRRERLAANIARFREGAAQLGLALLPSTTAIQALVLGSEQVALDASAALYERNLLVVAIRPPTVPVGSSRLRITLSAVHTESEIDRLLDALATVASSTAAHGSSTGATDFTAAAGVATAMRVAGKSA